MKKILSIVSVVLLVGCSTLSPTADPLIVRVEQTQTVATASLDDMLKVHDANRLFWKTNAPAFANFCNYLDQWVYVDGVSNRLWVSYLQSLDRVKLSYKVGTADSNAVVTVLATVETALTEAQQYITMTQTNHP